MAGFFSRVDDAINPIVVKELRQAVKSRFVVAVLIIFLLLELGWIGLQLLVVGFQGRIDSLDFQGGREIFMSLQVILMATCLLFVPLYTAVRLAAERNEANVDLLFVTTIRPSSIIAGKIVSAVVLAILIFSTCMPFMGLTYYLRGIDWATILFVLAIDFLVVIVSVQLMVFLAVIPANLVFRALLGLFGLGCLVTIFGYSMAMTSLLMFYNVNSMMNSEFWYLCGGIVLLMAAIGGLLFSWSVALVSSPSSNRALAVRLYMFTLTVVSGAISLGLCFAIRGVVPLRGVVLPFLMWMWVAALLAAVYAIIAINERREWSPRIARQIPKSFLGRVLAFPLFSGAAGGMVFSVLMMSVVGVTAWCVMVWSDVSMPFRPTGFGPVTRDWYLEMTLEATSQVFLYAYCYCMTALFLQRIFLTRLHPTLTWVVGLCLFALGMVLPYLIILFFFGFDRWEYDRQSRWLLTNPFQAVYETTRSHDPLLAADTRINFWIFLALWGGIVTLLNVRWLLSQFAHFRRIEFTPPPDALPTAIEAAPRGDALP